VLTNRFFKRKTLWQLKQNTIRAEENNKYNQFTLKKKIWFYDAIDYMQSYNGETDFKCIALAMGYDNYEWKTTLTLNAPTAVNAESLHCSC
jgi:hypothetical protein